MRYVVLFTLLWWILAGSHADSWLLGVPVIVLASYLAHRLAPAGHTQIRWLAVPGFMVYFTWQSIVAGADVARRTLHPSLPLKPGFADIDLTLPEGAPRVFFGAVISLLPGTLCAELTNSGVRLHVLDTSADIEADCRKTEKAIARLFRAGDRV